MNIVDAICKDGIQIICIISTGSGRYCPHMQSFFQILCDTKLVLEQHVAAVSSQSTHPNLIKLNINKENEYIRIESNKLRLSPLEVGDIAKISYHFSKYCVIPNW